jgi:hypothetical protein
MMRKSYRYRGFVIVVESELLTTEPETLYPDVPLGYVAVIEITVDHKPGFATSTFEVGTSSGKLFQREAEVFAAATTPPLRSLTRRLGHQRMPRARAECVRIRDSRCSLRSRW